MPEHPSSSIRRRARSTVDQPRSGLAPPVQAIAAESLPPRDRSLPAALCTVAGAVAATVGDRGFRTDSQQFDRLLEPVLTATTLLEGYVRLRLAVVTTGFASPSDERAGRHTDWIAPLLKDNELLVDRDLAILASDHLHASSYAMAASTPVPDDRLLELYRCLIEGSTSLSQEFLTRAEMASTSEEPSTSEDRFGVEATLAETATDLATIAVGAPTETRTALGRYSHALMTALASQSSLTTDGVDPRTSAARILSGDSTQQLVEDAPSVASDVESDLERARTALETLVESVGDVDVDLDRGAKDVSAPLVRLERATRQPFRNHP